MHVSSSARRFSLLFALSLLAAVAFVTAPRDAAGAGGPSIGIISAQNTIAAEFSKLNCKIVSENGKKRFVVSAKSNGWKLDMALNRFDGYHKYKLTYGQLENQVNATTPGNIGYYTSFGPDGQDGGFVNFGKDKKGKPDKTKLEVTTVSYAVSGYTVGIYGAAKCTYPKKRK